MAAQLKSRRLLKRYSYPFALQIKYLNMHTMVHTDSNHVFLHICVRIFIASKIRVLKVSLFKPCNFGIQQNGAI